MFNLLHSQAYYAGDDNPAMLEREVNFTCSYVFNKVKRPDDEAFDATEDMNNVEITLENYGDDDMDDDEEWSVC